MTLLIRLQNTENIPTDRFTSNDAYLFAWQAQVISEHGTLPERDMHRWLPTGRDNKQFLPLWSYLIAYYHKAVGWISPLITLYTTQLYLPPFLFTIALGILCLFLTRIHSIYFAMVVGVVIATLPGTLDRSSIGFADRDVLCLMLGIVSIITYLWKEYIENKRHRYYVTGLSGLFIFLGGLSWEGFGCFMLIVIAVELWKFCTTSREERLSEYILWVIMFVPTLYVASPIYRHADGFATHVAALMLYPSIVVLVLRCSRYLLLHYIEVLRGHGRILASTLTVLGISGGLAYFFISASAFESTAFAFRESLMMSDISELIDPAMIFWILRYGCIIVIGTAGLMVMCLYLWKTDGIFLSLSLFLFSATTFTRDLIDMWNVNACDNLFYLSLGLIVISLSILCFSNKRDNSLNTREHDKLIFISTLAWFLIWVGLSRGAVRYDFFVGVPLAVATAWFTWYIPSVYRHIIMGRNRRSWLAKLAYAGTFIPTVLLIPIIFWSPLGGFTNRFVQHVNVKRGVLPGHEGVEDALIWMKKGLPPDAVVASSWGYGSLINIIGGAKTIIDQDTFIPHRIALFYRHVYCAQDIDEALTFLKTHHATHLMLIRDICMIKAPQFSKIGSLDRDDREFEFIQMSILPRTSNTPQRLIRLQDTPFRFVDVFDMETENEPQTLTAFLKNGGSQTSIPYLTIKDYKRHFQSDSETENEHGSIILLYDEDEKLMYALYVSQIGWQSVFVRLYMNGEADDIFVPIYPEDKDEIGHVKVWEIRYPDYIKADPKYLIE